MGSVVKNMSRFIFGTYNDSLKSNKKSQSKASKNLPTTSQNTQTPPQTELFHQQLEPQLERNTVTEDCSPREQMTSSDSPQFLLRTSVSGRRQSKSGSDTLRRKSSDVSSSSSSSSTSRPGSCHSDSDDRELVQEACSLASSSPSATPCPHAASDGGIDNAACTVDDSAFSRRVGFRNSVMVYQYTNSGPKSDVATGNKAYKGGSKARKPDAIPTTFVSKQSLTDFSDQLGLPLPPTHDSYRDTSTGIGSLTGVINTSSGSSGSSVFDVTKRPLPPTCWTTAIDPVGEPVVRYHIARLSATGARVLRFSVSLGDAYGVGAMVMVKANSSGRRVHVIARSAAVATAPTSSLSGVRSSRCSEDGGMVYRETFPLPVVVDPTQVTARVDSVGRLMVEGLVVAPDPLLHRRGRKSSSGATR